MQAGEREFRLRFWIFFGLFWAAFLCYRLDHVNAGQWLIGRLAPSLASSAPAERHALQALFGVAAAIAFVAAGLRTWATAYLRREIVHDGAVRTEGLVADGPYRHVRNPLYLGTQLNMLGVAFVASRLGALVLLAGGLVFHLRLIGREEAALAAAQGEAFRAYAARVPRLVPALAPRVPSSGRSPRWGQAIVAESFFWIMAIALVVFALTLDARSLFFSSMGGLALFWILTAVLRRSGGAQPESRVQP